ncbi:hypothetical protein IWQ60_012497, partial [Tieghemiomyces parasiticus]
MPTTVKAIQRLTGGVNSIAGYLPWASILLAPFHALTSKTCLSKADIDDLLPYWDSLTTALCDVKNLYEPRPGEPLTLRVNAAEAGVGAVLLAHPSGSEDDVAVVAYWFKAFAGAQGRRHPGFREAWGLLGATRHFYSYLDGAVNLRIE